MSANLAPVVASEPSNVTGYRSFRLGKFELSRDAYFVSVRWPAKGAKRSHQMPADAFLRACMRDVAWNFFYGWVNFDSVIGTRNHYGKVDFYAGTFNGALKEAGVDYLEQFDSGHIMATFKAILRDWVNEGFDPFAAPVETGTAFGPKQGDNIAAIERTRIATQRMPGLPGDSPLRDDMPVNRAFADVAQDEPEIHAEPGFEGEVHAFNMFAYVSRSDVTWNPSVVSVVNDIQVPAGETTDQQLADRIGKQLAYDRVGYGNAFNAITVSVNNGVATLGGHALGPVAKESALNLTKRTPGVQNVVDKIQVDPLSPMDDQLRVRVARTVYGYPSLNKYAINPANPIRITVVNGHVILSGVVDNKSDKDVAGIQANTEPGVFSVTNNLQVAGQPEERRQ